MPSARGQIVQVSRILNERAVSSFHVKLIIWLLIVVFIAGSDMGTTSLAASELLKAWKITNHVALGAVIFLTVYRVSEVRLHTNAIAHEAKAE